MILRETFHVKKENLIYIWKWDNKVAGVTILLKGDTVHPLQHKEIVVDRLLQAPLETQGTAFELLAVYAPANREARGPFLERVAITMPTGYLVMLTEDFNCVINKKDRVSRGSGTGMDRSSRQLKQLVRDHSLVDTTEGAQGPREHFTQVDPAGSTKSRIDYVFLPTGWNSEKACCTPVCFSDHSLLTLRADLGRQLEKGRGVWKLNTNLLEDERTRHSYREHYTGWRTLQNLYQNQTERLKKSQEEVMTCLKDGGLEHWLKDSMLATADAFYQELYTEKPVDPEAMQLCL
ncbi:hypothetical protein Y1Q_0016842 [Alligator mississippiensis]|uniref:Endonuclease/exonuclease/phosphatase domain-containing protein n=1 Tax=Alligator mississippiensis TaxID=8496 RepID=A0A151P6N7_ALLMI|nr:hypothetical protein Y1Q_0016842 [Alligator mississippiensis]